MTKQLMSFIIAILYWWPQNHIANTKGLDALPIGSILGHILFRSSWYWVFLIRIRIFLLWDQVIGLVVKYYYFTLYFNSNPNIELITSSITHTVCIIPQLKANFSILFRIWVWYHHYFQFNWLTFGSDQHFCRLLLI